MSKLISWIFLFIVASSFVYACSGEIITKDGVQVCRECEAGFNYENGTCVLNSSYHYEQDSISKGFSYITDRFFPENNTLGFIVVILIIAGIMWYLAVDRKRF